MTTGAIASPKTIRNRMTHLRRTFAVSTNERQQQDIIAELNILDGMQQEHPGAVSLDALRDEMRILPGLITAALRTGNGTEAARLEDRLAGLPAMITACQPEQTRC